jgi:PAS domain S-box-containing protein
MKFSIGELLRPRKSSDPGSPVSRYGVAAAVVLVMAAIRFALDPILGAQAPYLPFALAVMVAALFGGPGPGFAATALSVLFTTWLFLEPRHSFALADPHALAGLALFFVVGSLIGLLVGRLRAALVSTAQAEEKLRRQSQLVDLSHDAIIALDSDWRIVRWNSGAEEMYGWSSAEALGQIVSDLLRTGGGIPLPEIHEMLSRQGRWEGELHHIARDGRRLWVESRQVLFRDDRNRSVGALEINRDVTGRKQAEEELRRASEQRDLALESANMGTWALEIAGGQVSWDERTRALFGVPAGVSVTRDGAMRSIHPEDRQRVDEALLRALDPASAGEYEAEFRVIWQDGSVRWVSAKGLAWFEGQGEARHAVRLAGTAQDITARKQAEERLRESEFFYRQTLESIPGMVFTTRPDGYCDYQSHQWVDYTGVPMNEHLGEGWNKLLHPDDRERAIAAWRNAAEGRAPYDLEYRVRRRDGAYEWFKVIGRPIRDEAGRIVRWFGAAFNIEDLKRAEKTTHQALEYRNLAMEAANLGAWEYRVDTGRVYWDERSAAMFGLPEKDLIDYGEVISRIHPDDRAPVDAAMKGAIAGADGGAYHCEFRVVCPDGSIQWVAGHGQVFFEGEGDRRRAVRFVGINMEITERKRSEERLRETQKLESVGLLAGGIAHDFNNLLTGIMGNASLVLDEVGPGPAERIREVIDGAERAAHLTRQLLAYSGKGQFVVRDLDVSQSVQETGDLVQFSIPKSVDLALNLQRRLPPVRMDPSQLQQILMNLVINAGEAIGEGKPGRITVSTAMEDVEEPFTDAIGQEVARGRYVSLKVQDNGSGIEEGARTRMFDPFYTTKFTGRGMGLAATAGIVRSQKGAIAVESAPGRGSTFRVLLPVAHGAVQALEEQPQANGRVTVLVVDDEASVREFIGAVLLRHGYRVLKATDGRDALAVFDRENGAIDAVVLDVVMPVMGANDLLPAIKTRRPHTKVLLTSGYSEAEARRLCAEYPGAAFIQKPYTATQIAAALQELLD